MPIGERIRTARKEARLTQAELAEKAGVAAITVHQYESGKRQPRIEHLVSIAAALGVHPLYLMDGVDENGDDAVQRAVKNFLDKQSEDSKKSYLNMITALFGRLNDTGREKVVSYAEGLLDNPKYTNV